MRLADPGIWPRGRTAGLALAASLAVHTAVLAGLAPSSDAVQMDGGAPVAIAAIGTDFQDFTQGADPSQPAPATQSATVAAHRPPPTPAAPAITHQPEAPTTPYATAELRTPAALQPSAQTVASATAVTRATPSAAAAPLTPDPEVTTRTAESDTPRPRQRPNHQARPAARSQTASAAQAAGDADRDARRGDARGRPQAAATVAAQREAPATAPGEAAAVNYPGQVMRQIQRVRRERLRARGVAVVAFAIAANGSLATARIARGSGDATLDRAALAHLQRAAPFPAPPPGAQTRFSFEFVGQ